METTASISRRGLYWPLAGLLVLALAWTGLWFFGRMKVTEALDQFFVRQAQAGRQWRCPDRSVAGYPFRIELRCKQPTYSMENGQGQSIKGALGGLTVVATTAGAFNLAHVIGEFEAPLVVEDSSFGKKTSHWTSARASLRGSANRLERVSIEIESPQTTLEINGEPVLQTRAEKLDMHIREALDAGESGAYDVAAEIKNAVVPPLDQVLGSNDPVNFELQARMLKIASIDRRDWRQSLENWRLGGGTLRVDSIKLQKGLPRTEAKGVLQLDQTRRLSGRLDAQFVNADSLLAQFGLGGGGGGGLLGALLGGGRSSGAGGATRPERTIRLPLVIENGRIGVGPFRLPGFQMRPLY